MTKENFQQKTNQKQAGTKKLRCNKNLFKKNYSGIKTTVKIPINKKTQHEKTLIMAFKVIPTSCWLVEY